jgi:hypothetical protein
MKSDYPKVQRWIARIVLLAVVISGAWFFTGQQVEVFVALGVGPVMRGDDGQGLPRDAVEVIHLTLVDEDGEQIAQSVMHLPRGIEGPVTPALALRVPAGKYLAEVRLQGPDGRRVTRLTKLTFETSGYLHVDLD